MYTNIIAEVHRYSYVDNNLEIFLTQKGYQKSSVSLLKFWANKVTLVVLDDNIYIVFSRPMGEQKHTAVTLFKKADVPVDNLQEPMCLRQLTILEMPK